MIQLIKLDRHVYIYSVKYRCASLPDPYRQYFSHSVRESMSGLTVIGNALACSSISNESVFTVM